MISQVKDAAMQEDVGKQLPEVKTAEHHCRGEAEKGRDRSAQTSRKDLHYEHHHAGDDDPLHRGCQGSPEGDGAGSVSIAVIHEITSREKVCWRRGAIVAGFGGNAIPNQPGGGGRPHVYPDWVVTRSGGVWGDWDFHEDHAWVGACPVDPSLGSWNCHASQPEGPLEETRETPGAEGAEGAGVAEEAEAPSGGRRISGKVTTGEEGEDGKEGEDEEPPRPPNVLLILVDDLGYGDLSSSGAEDLQTPHIDALVEAGMRFNQFYANSTVGAPTRASLLTGRYPDLVGVPGTIRPEPEINWGYLTPEATLLPDLLQQAGYHTALIGKWHLGLESPNLPNERGFHLFRGFLADRMDDYFRHTRRGVNHMRFNAETVEPAGPRHRPLHPVGDRLSDGTGRGRPAVFSPTCLQCPSRAGPTAAFFPGASGAAGWARLAKSGPGWWPSSSTWTRESER